MLANISFDIDGKWSALNYFNIASNPKKDEFIEIGIPKILEILDNHKIKSNFFLVGRNIINYKKLHKKIAENHEIGNHSFSHPHNLSSLGENTIRLELKKTHDLIKKTLGVVPTGFRAPTYGINSKTLKILSELNYNYDSSYMPAYYPGITPFKNLFLKRQPHKINELIEIPVSVHPILPFYLNGTSIISLGMPWLKSALPFMKLSGRPLIINFHERDAIETLPPILAKQFKRSKNNSLKIIEDTIIYLKQNTKLVTMGQLVDIYNKNL